MGQVYTQGIYRSSSIHDPKICARVHWKGATQISALPEQGHHRLSALAEQHGLFYARFMDDWVILSPTRWKLKEAIRVGNQCLEALQVRQHPDKTFVGRVERGFDFLGYEFDESGLIGLSRRSIRRFAGNIASRISAGHDSGQLAAYVRRWWSWAMGGLKIKKPEKEVFLKKEKFLDVEKIRLTKEGGGGEKDVW